MEEMLQKYIDDLCATENIKIDLRFASLGDENLFYYEDCKYGCPLRREQYHVENIEEVKKLIANTYLVRLWQQAKQDQKIALYVGNIVNTGNGYNVSVGGGLFKDFN